MQVHEWLADALYQYVAKNVNYSLSPRPTLVISLAARYKVTHNNITLWLDGGVMPNITGTILMHVPSPGPLNMSHRPGRPTCTTFLNFIHFVSQLLPKENSVQNRHRCQKYGRHENRRHFN